MIKLPLSTVQPRRACAAMTESTTFCPVHSLGQRPAHGEQFNLKDDNIHCDVIPHLFCDLLQLLLGITHRSMLT